MVFLHSKVHICFCCQPLGTGPSTSLLGFLEGREQERENQARLRDKTEAGDAAPAGIPDPQASLIKRAGQTDLLPLSCTTTTHSADG